MSKRRSISLCSDLRISLVTVRRLWIGPGPLVDEEQSGGAIQFEVDMACSIIAATAVLNNYCRDSNIHQSVDDDVMRYTLEERHHRSSTNARGDVQDELVHGHSTRQSIVNEYFR